MHMYPLLEILAIGLVFALVFGYIAKRFGFSPIVGYLLAGFIIGPATPGFVGDASMASELSEVGVILMMFGVGLHFDVKDLLAVKGVSLPGALIQSTVSTICGLLVAEWLGFEFEEGLILGMGLAVASTVVLLRILSDNNMVDTVHGHVAVGWLIVEDILTVLILVMLPTFAGIMSGTGGGNTLEIVYAFGVALGKLVLLWVVVMVLGGKVVPWLLITAARTRSQELFTLTTVGAAFAIAVGAAVFFDASIALGAFLGGMAVGRSSLHHQAGAVILPLKDIFSVLFFVSVGMMFSPSFVAAHYVLVLACLGVVLLVKPIVAALAVIFLGYSAQTAITVAVALAQVGEFSFILSQQAMQYNIINENVYLTLVVCALVSITINPGYFKLIPKILNLLKRNTKIWTLVNGKSEKKAAKNNTTEAISLDNEAKDALFAIVVGYGPSGRRVTASLKRRGIIPIILELNADTVNELIRGGMHAIYGDSTKIDILHAAGIEKAAYLVLTTSNTAANAGTIVAARTFDNDLKILARVRFIKDAELLMNIGADKVATEENTVADKLAEIIDRIDH